MARRELVKEAAELSVEVAGHQIKRRITDQDRLRLVDQYLEQVKTRG
jgi:hypothetical protein